MVLSVLIGCTSLPRHSTADVNMSRLAVARIPSQRLVLGSSLEEVVSATEQCSIEAEAPCALEEYAAELASGTAVVVDSFFIHRYEVSQADYQRCVERGVCRPPRTTSLPASFLGEALPAIMLTQGDARRYCEQLGGRLPSEAHYEAAAAGASGRRYPWGNFKNSHLANFGSLHPPYSDPSDGYELLAPVVAFVRGASPQGVVQLAGNVAEWTDTRFSSHASTQNHGAGAAQVVVKGGSFQSLPASQRTRARRSVDPGTAAIDIGFRCIFGSVVNRASY